MTDAEVSEILTNYPDKIRDVSLELNSLQYEMESLQAKKLQMEKEILVRLYQEYPTIPGANDPLAAVRKERYYEVLERDLLYRSVQTDVRNLQFRLTSLVETKEFYANKLRATLLLVDRGSNTPR